MFSERECEIRVLSNSWIIADESLAIETESAKI